MNYIQQSFNITFEYKTYFTSDIFNPDNSSLKDFLLSGAGSAARKILFVVDEGLILAGHDLKQLIPLYFDGFESVKLVPDIIVVPGGEQVKNDTKYYDQILEAVNVHGIDRHSFIAAVGGGSVLDMVGFAAAVSHRGIKHIRIPTTVLSQNDSGVGVKNGINFFNKKNFLGTFAPPVAVFNDDLFLTSLSDRDWRSGISEAVKVAIIKDSEFFNWLEEHAFALAGRNRELMNYLIHRCAQLHIEHIAGRDPFETGSSRPLDFGHWSAHKLETLSNFQVLHGEAVAMGIALDTVYSKLDGRLSDAETERVIRLLLAFGFELTHPLMDVGSPESALYQGLEEFREHLGGRLTIMLLNRIGEGTEVHEIDAELLRLAGEKLKTYQ